MSLIDSPDLDDPEFKKAQHDSGRGGGGGIPYSPPGVGIGGGYGSFFGSPTAGVPGFSGITQGNRKDLYALIHGFQPWMDAGGSGGSLPVAMAAGGVVPNTDTVPAMLTPGERVASLHAQDAMPGLADLIDLANALGIQHFAFGGTAKPSVLTPWMTGGRWGSPTPAPAPAPAPTGTPTTGGDMPVNTMGNSGNPFGWTGGARGPSDTPAGKTLTDILNEFFKNGTFSPTGSADVMNAVKENALGAADAARQRAATLSVLSGADPASRANYMLQTDLVGQGAAAGAVNNAVYDQLKGQQAFGQNTLNGLLSFLYNYWQSQQDYEHGSGRPGGV